MKKILLWIGIMLSLFVLGCGMEQAGMERKSEAVELHVAAAASLTDVLQEIAAGYEREHPKVKVIFNFGSSGALQQAIQNGGRTDLFFSASVRQMDALEKDGLLAEDSRRELLRNEVVLIVPSDGGKSLQDFRDLTRADIQHIALGEPQSVPVGQYAEEVFMALGILEPVKAKAVYGADVRQVLSWVETGNADCGVVYATDAASSNRVSVVAIAPAGSHTPIVYPAAMLKDSKHPEEARDFLNFVGNDDNKKLFAKYGFEVK